MRCLEYRNKLNEQIPQEDKTNFPLQYPKCPSGKSSWEHKGCLVFSDWKVSLNLFLCSIIKHRYNKVLATNLIKIFISAARHHSFTFYIQSLEILIQMFLLWDGHYIQFEDFRFISKKKTMFKYLHSLHELLLFQQNKSTYLFKFTIFFFCLYLCDNTE